MEVFHKSAWSKLSVKSNSPSPDLKSWVDNNACVGKNVGVSVAGNQIMVGVTVWVSETMVMVSVGAAGRPLQAARNTSMNMPRYNNVSFIGK